MIDSSLVAFAVAAALLTIAPGADTMLVLRNVLRGGRGDGVVTTLGICSGLFAHATLSALGVSVLLMHSAAAFHLVKLAGASYLAWLGLRSLHGALQGSYLTEKLQGTNPKYATTKRQCFAEGLLSNVLNPKTAVFYLAFLPQFIRPTESAFTQSLFLAGVHYVESILWLVALSILFDQMRQFILKSAVRRWLDGLCGAVLVGFGLRLAFARQ